jgi:hypothetical protein
MLARNPGFTTVAVLTLALGIGANTAVFTVADTLLLRPPPFDHSERERNRSFDYMVAWRNWWFSVAGPSGSDIAAERVRGVNVSPSFFDMLGVQAALGRTFQPDEEEPGRDQVVVLTDGFGDAVSAVIHTSWERRHSSMGGHSRSSACRHPSSTSSGRTPRCSCR